ncbi:hypothetical protein LGM58_41835 [Burkholderia contaminans]|uniref:hypothetical protein n=1 Tax=Burkholderia contaminans TaxID=488447 RepID=UPI001CF214E9|nr:hypothetical protein [Burkholderia contaminans]MCA7889722.1 hypothetical protein [Burkholderia contaminans]
MTIVQNVSCLNDERKVATAEDFLQAVDAVLPKIPPSLTRGRGRALLRLLEAYLLITKRSLSLASLASAVFEQLCNGFIGALHSHFFWDATHKTRYQYHLFWCHIIEALGESHVVAYFPLRPTTTPFWTWHLCDCVKNFHELSKDLTAIDELSVHVVSNVLGEARTLHLAGLKIKFGEKFRDTFYEISDVYFSRGAGNTVDHINRIASFLSDYPDIDEQRLLDDAYSTKLWTAFLEHYIESKITSARIDVIVVAWHHDVEDFLFNHLFKSGLAVKPTTFISPPRKFVVGHPRHIISDRSGVLHTDKLLTAIPLELTDQQAVDLLFHKIGRAVDIINEWAESARQRVYAAALQRNEWERNSDFGKSIINSTESRSQMTSRINPRHLEHASATIAHYGGYVTRNEVHDLQDRLPSGMRKLARELGMPTSDALLPFVTILVFEHPEITPSFLEKLQIYNEKGELDNFFYDDSGWILRGVKMRKGSLHAEQQVVLTERARAVVNELLRITEAPRNYLRARQHPDWRYLLITTGAGFAIPSRLADISTCTSDKQRVRNTAKAIAEVCRISKEEAEDLSKSFSLPSLRASLGVLEYIRTCSGEAMAKKLGHAKYERRLLAHYLPEAIRKFLRTRYIRIMQTGILVEAMNGSPYLLEASGFRSIDELNTFLNNHTLRFAKNRKPTMGLIDGQTIDLDSNTEYDRILFNVTEDVLTVYASLDLAVSTHRTSTAIAHYWNQIGRRLFRYIDEKRTAEPSHAAMLDNARRRADSRYVEDIVYGSQQKSY